MSRKQPSLGKSLMRDHKKKARFVVKDGHRHTSDLPDGRDWAKLNLNSVTEQTSLKDFLDITELAAAEYDEEFANIKVVKHDEMHGILTEEEKLLVEKAQTENKDVLCIPRRPSWDTSTSKEELDAKEKSMFLDWRKKLSQLQEDEHINLTPYEKNLEIWRQLWRVIERSDVIVQIIDARNPLLFYCRDLEMYVKEIDSSKENILLLNKADFLNETQRLHWCRHFEKTGIKIAFFSALQDMERSPEDAASEKESIEDDQMEYSCDGPIINSPKMLSRKELMNFMKEVGRAHSNDSSSVVGMVGYPNVGKSSTINCLLMNKKVCVSATPGKTKHFQTHIIDEELCLCDCPGLVFPNFVSTKAEMVINGILPIDQLTNCIQPVSLVTNMIPREILESTYSIIIPPPVEGRSEKSPPTAEEFLNAHGYNRGFMTQRGLPDNSRSSRYVLKDFVNGRLLYCHAPPEVKQEDYFQHRVTQLKNKSSVEDHKSEKVPMKPAVPTGFDGKFFTTIQNQAHTKGVKSNSNILKTADSEGSSQSLDKPWKKHHNRNKKEKLRRIYKASCE